MLKPGLFHEVTFSVTEDLTARAVGSGQLPVLATPVMIARMEQAAWMAVAPCLAEGEGTVGTRMDAAHVSATPLGLPVTCRAELIGIDGRRLTFRVSARDSHGPIGEGTHERVVIQNEKFLQKARKKASGED